MQSCQSRCFDYLPRQVRREHSPCQPGPRQKVATHRVREEREFPYSQLSPWQTRVLRLYPWDDDGDTRESQAPLEADLVDVNLVSDSGWVVAVGDSSHIIQYEAISYSWGHPGHTDAITCGLDIMRISQENADALRALRHRTKSKHYWIDAICINQRDQKEKATQVAQMLQIFGKAKSVTAWLGKSNSDTHAVFTYIHRMDTLQRDLSVGFDVKHAPQCFHNLEAVRGIILRCSRSWPWLRRTWVRQEVFAANGVRVRCGDDQASLHDFLNVFDLLSLIDDWLLSRGDLPDLPGKSASQLAVAFDALGRLRRLVLHAAGSRGMGSVDAELAVTAEAQYIGGTTVLQNLDVLLREARLNAHIPLHGVKIPRELTEVLFESRNFEVTDERDGFYAILGMCNIPATSEQIGNATGDRVVVDYSKSVSEVYNDASRFILGRQQKVEDLWDLWHNYKRSPLHAQGLASWAVDWRSGVVSHSWRRKLGGLMRPCRRARPSIHPSNNGRESLQTSSPEKTLDDVRRWAPLWEFESSDTDERIQAEPGHNWHWPKASSMRPRGLDVTARVLNYVAHLTDFTCEAEDFIQWTSYDEYQFSIGSTGFSIHSEDRPCSRTPLLNRIPTNAVRFDASKHDWRLAILGIAHDEQLCLVPATTVKGDLVLAVAPGLLPMIIHSCQGDVTLAGLLPSNDPYDDLPHSERATEQHQVLVDHLARFLEIGLFICTYVFNFVLYFLGSFGTLDWQDQHMATAARITLLC